MRKDKRPAWGRVILQMFDTNVEREIVNKTKEKIQRRYDKYNNKWRAYDLFTCILAMLGLVAGIIDVSSLA